MNHTNTNLTFRNAPLRITSPALQVGMSLPQFTLTAQDMSDLTNTLFAGKVLIVSVVPSLDTPTCALQTKRFNKEATNLSDSVVVLTVSMDLPFAQKRWCGAEGISRVVTGSDYKHRTFGPAFGVFAADMGLMCRAVFVADQVGVIQYIDYVPELSEEPEYDGVLHVVRDMTGG